MFEIAVLDIKKSSIIFKNHASSVVLPAEDGEMTILDFHQAMITTLKKGILRIDNRTMHIEGGIAAVKDNELTVLVEKS